MSDRKAYPNRSAESNRILHLLSRTRSERTKVPTDPGRTIDQTQLAHLRGLGNSTGNLSVLVEAKPFSRLLEQLPLAITRRPIRRCRAVSRPNTYVGGLSSSLSQIVSRRGRVRLCQSDVAAASRCNGTLPGSRLDQSRKLTGCVERVSDRLVDRRRDQLSQ